MYIYNVTYKIDHSILQDWLVWLEQEHIPEIIATGCFTQAVTLRLLETDETDGLTYAVQYYTDQLANYHRYLDEHAQVLRKKSSDKWKDRFIAFRSIMEVVN